MGILRVGKECEMTIERKIGFEMWDGGEIVRIRSGNKFYKRENKILNENNKKKEEGKME